MQPKHASFIRRSILVTLVLSLLSAVLMIAACSWLMKNEVAAQEDKARRIALNAAGQRLEDILGLLGSFADYAEHVNGYNELLSGGFTSNYQKNSYVNLYSKVLGPHLSQLEELTVQITTFPDAFAIIYTGGDNTYGYYPNYSDYRKLTDLLGQNGMPDSAFYLTMDEAGEQRRLAITTARTNEQTGNTAYFTILLSELFDDMLTGGEFTALISDGRGAAYSLTDDPLSEPEADRYVQPLAYQGWTLTALYPHAVPSVYLITPISTAIIGLWIALSCALVRWAVNRRVSELRALSVAMDARCQGEPAYAPIPSKEHKKLSLRGLLILLFMFVVLSTTLLTTVLFYSSNVESNEDHVRSVYAMAAKHLNGGADKILSQYLETARRMAVDEDVQLLFSTDRSERNDDRLWIVQEKLGYAPPVCSNIAIYSMDHTLIASSVYSERYMSLSETTVPINTEQIYSHRQKWSYLEEGLSCIRVSIMIVGANSDIVGYGKKLGWMLLDFDYHPLQQLLETVQEEKCYYALYDADGTCLMYSDGLSDPNIQSGLSDATWEKTTLEGVVYSVNTSRLDTSKWTLKIFVADTLVQAQLQTLRWYLLLFVIVVFIALSILSVLLERNLTNALRALNKTMDITSSGNMTALYKPHASHPDEIRLLGLQFNRMLSSLDSANQTALQLERKSREFEINMLQAQVDPHFLYNTLRTAQVLIKRGDPQVISMIDWLITFFRASSRLGDIVVPLRVEYSQIRAYIDILKIRFSNLFNFEIEFPEELMDCQVVRFCLQPLVENAFKHGVSTMKGGGYIRLRALARDEMLIVSVEDNGQGMSPESVINLQNQLEHSEYNSHIGVLNVHQRIRLAFGPQYGVEVESFQPDGIRFTMTFPLSEADCDE